MVGAVRFLVVAWMVGCSGPAGPDVPPAPPLPPPADTPAPPPPTVLPGPPPALSNPELERRVAVLAGFGRIESSHIGAAGAPSQAFAAFVAVREVSTPADLVALLGHPSPVVRGYVARHILGEVPGAIPAALPLLDDRTLVGRMEGCEILDDSTVGGVVADALCFSNLEEARAQVARMAREPGPRSIHAISCIGSRSPGEAAQLALGRLQVGGPMSAADRAGLLRIVGNGGLGTPACAFHVAGAAAPEEDVRVAAAQGLSECASPEGLDALRRLALDDSALVSRIARGELALHPLLPGPEREALLADPVVSTRVAVQLSFRLRRPEALPRLADSYRALAIAHPTLSWNGIGGLPESPAATDLARAVAAAVPVGTNARRDAMGYVSSHATAADLPELRRSLDSANVSEVIDAIEALARLRDPVSRPAIARLVRHDNASVVRAATAALR